LHQLAVERRIHRQRLRAPLARDLLAQGKQSIDVDPRPPQPAGSELLIGAIQFGDALPTRFAIAYRGDIAQRKANGLSPTEGVGIKSRQTNSRGWSA
jgi:hypothetical protein